MAVLSLHAFIHSKSTIVLLCCLEYAVVYHPIFNIYLLSTSNRKDLPFLAKKVRQYTEQFTSSLGGKA